tara:strand:- start:476 stop:874 length:399 start_codon:yes stop_codon:yes gene_type:complete
MIRIKNIDFETEGMKRHVQASLGDVTAGVVKKFVIFSAPVDCVVEGVKVYSGAQKSESSILRLYHKESTATTLASALTASATALAPLEFTITENNSLTAGRLLGLTISLSGADPFSGVLVDVKYKPSKHRGN